MGSNIQKMIIYYKIPSRSAPANNDVAIDSRIDKINLSCSSFARCPRASRSYIAHKKAAFAIEDTVATSDDVRPRNDPSVHSQADLQQHQKATMDSNFAGNCHNHLSRSTRTSGQFCCQAISVIQIIFCETNSHFVHTEDSVICFLQKIANQLIISFVIKCLNSKNLLKRIKDKIFSNKELVKIIYQIADGMKYIHSKRSSITK